VDFSDNTKRLVIWGVIISLGMSGCRGQSGSSHEPKDSAETATGKSGAAQKRTRCERLETKLDDASHALVPVLQEVYPEVIREVVPISKAEKTVQLFRWEAEARLKTVGFGTQHAQKKQVLLQAAGCTGGEPQADVCAVYQQQLPGLMNNDYMRVMGEALGVALARSGEPEPDVLAERAAKLLPVRGDERMTSYLAPYTREFSEILGCEFL
jgi:hypothetical protein